MTAATSMPYAASRFPNPAVVLTPSLVTGVPARFLRTRGLDLQHRIGPVCFWTHSAINTTRFKFLNAM
jgi:hypothetical protein